MGDHIVVKNVWNREKVIQSIIYVGLQNKLVLFGGYLRDCEILNNPRDLKDLDFVYFSSDNYSSFVLGLSLIGLNWKELRKVKITRKLNKTYGGISKYIDEVTTIQISSFRGWGGNVPGSMRITIDLVKVGNSSEQWMDTHDCDFSCNLFIMDHIGMRLRYVSDEVNKVIKRDTLPFTAESYIKRTMRDKKFFIVMKELHFPFQYHRLLKRSKRMMDKGWEMISKPNKSIYPFILSKNKELATYHEGPCPICLTYAKKNELKCILHCNHVYCYSCICSFVEKHTSDRKKDSPVCPTCRAPLIK